MVQSSLQAQIEVAAAFIKSRAMRQPQVIITTGSGLAGLSNDVSGGVAIPYGEIPGFPESTVEGHPGELVLGNLEGREVAIQRGRAHLYEGYPLSQITLAIRALRALGASTLIVTNAAGGINRNFRAGDLMLITDHIGFPAMAGSNPLFGPNESSLGPRFPVMGGAYDKGLRQTALRIAADKGIALREGVYAWVGGPSFETPAEIRFLRTVGADAVGMSTVPEVIVARHGGMRVLGISLITNMAADHEPMGDSLSEVHQEVLEASARAVPNLTTLVKGVLRELS